jgi:hypothetical protein
MTDLYGYGYNPKREEAAADRSRSHSNAMDQSGDYMGNVGREGIKRQQERMLSRAADVSSDYDAGEYVRSQKRAPKRTPPRQSGRR